MRKKSHITLANFLSRELQLCDMTKYTGSFCLGSILPDLTPSIVTEPHQIRITFEGLKEKIHEVSKLSHEEKHKRSLWRKIGVILHYIADYFTFPHNDSYTGSLKDHCAYEGDLKHQMRAYVTTEDAQKMLEKQRDEMTQCTSVEELFRKIEKAHREYIGQGSIHTPKDDCRWIMMVCSGVLLYFLNLMKTETDRAVSKLIQAA